jgi:hypothetical protein
VKPLDDLTGCYAGVGDPDQCRPMFGNPLTPWRPWFAWRPIKTWDQRRRWLCWVERRLIQKHIYLDGGHDFWWQHRVLGETP